jgi:alcohol dehydrogenase class IV
MERTEPDRMAELARATGSGRDAAVDVRGLISLLGLPQHIADFGIGKPELKRAATELAGKYTAEDLLEIYLAAL